MKRLSIIWTPLIGTLLLLFSTGCYTQLKMVKLSERHYRTYTNRNATEHEYTKVRSDTDSTGQQVIINNYYNLDADWCDWVDGYYPPYRFSLSFFWGYYDPFLYAMPFFYATPWPYFFYYRPSGFLYSPFVVLYPYHFFFHSFRPVFHHFGRRPFVRRMPVGSGEAIGRTHVAATVPGRHRVVVRHPGFHVAGQPGPLEKRIRRHSAGQRMLALGHRKLHHIRKGRGSALQRPFKTRKNGKWSHHRYSHRATRGSHSSGWWGGFRRSSTYRFLNSYAGHFRGGRSFDRGGFYPAHPWRGRH